MSNHPLLDSAHNAMRSQHWALAARMFDAVLAELPQSLPARTGRARCAMLQAQPAIAVTHLQEAARLARRYRGLSVWQAPQSLPSVSLCLSSFLWQPTQVRGAFL